MTSAERNTGTRGNAKAAKPQLSRRGKASAQSRTTSSDDERHAGQPQFIAAAGLSGLLIWLSFPPVNLWPMAWLAPVGWVWLILLPRMPGKRPYRTLYVVGCFHWLLIIHWIRLPHWTANFGWLALSLYLGCYLPLFIGLARVATHRLRVPIVLAAPMIWTGLELARAYMLTGFSMAQLGHTQVNWPMLLQVADLGGAYTVSFLIMLVAACLVKAWSVRSSMSVAYVGFGLAAIGATLAYGRWRIEQPIENKTSPVKVALIQGSIDTQFDLAPEEYIDAFPEHMDLSRQAIRDHDDLDLIVWPESTYTGGLPRVMVDPDFVETDELRERLTAEDVRRGVDKENEKNHWVSSVLQTPLLVGCEAMHFRASRVDRFNSALLIDISGDIIGRYDKMHPVMFGEYIPFGNVFPGLYDLTPMDGGLTAGQAPVVFEVGGLKFCPSICYENTVSQLIRNQVSRLIDEGAEPDILVTVTNDGWFWGSSQLDMHLACGVFRAIECRKPMLIAANTGFSASIDGNGRVLEQGPRRQKAVLTVTAAKDGRSSAYLLWGDCFAMACTALCVLAGLVGILRPTR